MQFTLNVKIIGHRVAVNNYLCKKASHFLFGSVQILDMHVWTCLLAEKSRSEEPFCSVLSGAHFDSRTARRLLIKLITRTCLKRDGRLLRLATISGARLIFVRSRTALTGH